MTLLSAFCPSHPRNRIMDSYTRVEAVENLKNSFKTFELMEAQRREGKVVPNERTYTCFIRALTKGRAPGLHSKANALLSRMKKLFEGGNDEIKPTIFTYNAVINACAESIYVDDGSSNGEAFKTAMKIFTELRQSNQLRIDHVTFGNMLRCSRLLPEESEQKDKFIAATFRLCCEQGWVNDFVIRDLTENASIGLQQSLLGGMSGEDVISPTFPCEWSRMIDYDRNKRSFESGEGRGRRGRGRGRGGGRGRGRGRGRY